MLDNELEARRRGDDVTQEGYMRCVYCGDIKPLAAFRKHYYGDSHYSFCKTCEQIESRRKYLTKRNRTPEQQIELDKINKLYEVREAVGLQSPRRRGAPSHTEALVDEQLKRISEPQ